MKEITPVISATGLYTPPETISNDELVASFNAYVELHNARNAAAIAAGEVEELQPSSAEFIEKASGIKSRHVLSKASTLDPECMGPRWPERSNDEISVMAEIGDPLHQIVMDLLTRRHVADNKGLVREIVPPHLLLLGESMRFRQHHENTFRPEIGGLASRPLQRARQKGDIQAELPNRGDMLCRIAVGNLETDAGMLLGETSQQVLKKAGCQGRKDAHA